MTRRTPEEYKWMRLQFDETLLTKHFTPQASKDVRFIVVHHMTVIGKGDGRANDKCYVIWQNRRASAHYGVDGEYVRQFVWDKDYAWATGSYVGNKYGISIEHANSTAGPRWLVGDETIKTGAKLVAHLHWFYKLGRPVSGKTLKKHRDFSSTACPGPYLGGSYWDEYVKECQRQYDKIGAGGPVTPPKPPLPTPQTYIVKRGDNLTDIARRFATTVANLVQWNRIEDPNQIEVGDELIVSPLASAPRLPSDILDLTNWKLTLPIGPAEHPKEIKQPQLDGFSDPRYLQVQGEGVAMRVWADGVTTSGSDYPRDEFREMKNRGKDNASWSSGGRHIMRTVMAVGRLPDRQDAVLGQVHDSKDDVLMVKAQKISKTHMKVTAEFSKGKNKGTETKVLAASYPLGKRFSIEISVVKGVAGAKFVGESITKAQSKTIGQRSGCYFKSGVYAQFNDSQVPAREYAGVILFDLDVSHT